MHIVTNCLVPAINVMNLCKGSVKKQVVKIVYPSNPIGVSSHSGCHAPSEAHGHYDSDRVCPRVEHLQYQALPEAQPQAETPGRLRKNAACVFLT